MEVQVPLTDDICLVKRKNESIDEYIKRLHELATHYRDEAHRLSKKLQVFAPKCSGCFDEALGQLSHMEPGGCLAYSDDELEILTPESKTP